MDAPKPDDYILASGVSHSVGDFCRAAFEVVGLDHTKYVVLDPEYARPLDISETRGDASKAKRELGWAPKIGVRRAREDHGGRRARGARRRRGIRLKPPTVLVPAFRRVDASRRAIRSLLEAGAGRILYVDDAGEGGGDEIAREYPVGGGRPHDRRRFSGRGRSTSASRRPAAAATTPSSSSTRTSRARKDYFERLAEAVAATPAPSSGAPSMYAQEPERVWSAGGAVEWWGRGIRVLHHGAPAA